MVLALCASLSAACGDDSGGFVSTGASPDSGMGVMNEDNMDDPGYSGEGCDIVEIDGELVEEHETNFTARFRIGEPYTKTIMLFGGETLEEDNVLANAYVLGLDKEDAQELAEEYPDFYLCNSPGGQAAAGLVLPYDLVPASCDVYGQIKAALRTFNINRVNGGDRTSIRFEGAPLELESVTDQNGNDATDQVTDEVFHLVTAVEQLTGESVLSFGTTN